MTAPAPAPTRTDTDDEQFHWVCECDTTRALCGQDVSSDPWTPWPSPIPLCPLCETVQWQPCPRCGMDPLNP